LRLVAANGAQNHNHPLCLKMPDKNGEKPLAYVFQANSATGNQLLKSLYEYSLSYEQQKWARFVHTLKASDFNCYMNK
jgi:hypothetical protein